MAHHIKIEPRAHHNKDGSTSDRKKDYVVVDHHRGKRVEVGVASSAKAAAVLISDHRQFVMAQHLLNHPNDNAYKIKHKIESRVQKEIADV